MREGVAEGTFDTRFRGESKSYVSMLLLFVQVCIYTYIIYVVAVVIRPRPIRMNSQCRYVLGNIDQPLPPPWYYNVLTPSSKYIQDPPEGTSGKEEVAAAVE